MYRLPSIIEEFEGKLKKLTSNPTPDKFQQAFIVKQLKLIDGLRDIYDTHSGFTLWDYFVEIQKSYDNLIKKDPQIDGLIINIDLRTKSKSKGYINITPDV